jgi:preprotein translocase subunit SecF
MGEDEENKEEPMEEADSEDIIPESEKTEEEKKEEKTLKQAVKKLYKFDDVKEKKAEHKEQSKKMPFKERIIDFYDRRYKQLLIIPFSILLISLIIIGLHVATTGDFVKKDVSLTGGTTLTINTDKAVDIKGLESYLSQKMPNSDLSVLELTQAGKPIGITVEGINFTTEDVLNVISSKIGDIPKDSYSVSTMGSSLGASFFAETIKAMYISFLFMAVVIFWLFGENIKLKIITTFFTIIAGFLIFGGTASIIKDIFAYIIGAGLLITYTKSSPPSFMVNLNDFSNIVVTLATIDILGIKMSTAGVAAFLMIIGYSVDTNIILTTKVIKRKSEGTIMHNILGAMSTGMMVSITAIAAVIVALIFTQSPAIKEIMTILLIGLISDVLYTWIQNVGILRMYLERKGASK